MKSVLIVSPRFPPINAADHHRVRMMLPLLAEHGWKAVVLCVDQQFVDGTAEPELLLTIPEDVEVVRCPAISQRLTRRAGFGSLALRSILSLRSAGDRLLRSRKFDLVFFSTTEFGLVPLGRRWKRRFGVPFVVDLQDPWVNLYYRETGRRPPGGPFKHWVTQKIASVQEGPTLRDAAHIISVSPKYPEILQRNHPYLSAGDFSVIPFAGSSRDFEIAKATRIQKHPNFPDDGRLHWLYAGTAPPGIRLALLSFLTAFKRATAAGILEEDSVRFHFVGTDYAPAGRERMRVTPIAGELGMAHMIVEHPARIPYLETLRRLSAADALFLFGWDDPGYTASKLYPYILARKPLLSILHEDSAANEVIRVTNSAVAVTFNEKSSVQEIGGNVFEGWFANKQFGIVPATSWEAFRRYTAESMTRQVADVFDRCMTGLGRR